MSFERRILAWYEKNKRDLPWRKTKDPYKIWLSEVIFQQTRIEQGLDYYRRFVKAFPTLESLARAPREIVMKHWQGLGYYSRARNLHETAIFLYKNKYHTLPSSYKELIKLKGIGKYTAAAIASIAFNEPVPLVDGNVYRLFARYFGIDAAIGTAKAEKIFLNKAGEMLNKKDPGTHNQALMELGALVCTPRQPACHQCPIQNNCYAFAHHLQETLPVTQQKKSSRKRFFIYFVITRDKHLYLRKRKADDIWKELYDFPLTETAAPLSKKKILEMAASKEGLTPKDILEISEPFIHQLTHQRITARFIRITLAGSKKPSWLNDCMAVNFASLKKFPFPRLIEKYLMQQHLLS